MTDLWWQTWQGLLPVGVLVVTAIVIRPTAFWPILIVGNMFGNGPRFYHYLFLDEAITGAALVGAFMTIVAGRRVSSNPPVGNKLASIHNMVYWVWLVYMLVLSSVGMSEDPRVIRWVLFYLMLGGCWFLARDERFRFPEPPRAMRLILVGAIAAFAAYLIQGVYSENALDESFSRFASQDYLWAGSAYATFPIALGMPAAVLFLKDRSYVHKVLSWVALSLFMAAGFYFLSRIVWLVMAAYLATNPERIGLRRAMTMSAAFLMLFVLAGPADTANLGPFFSELLAPSLALSSRPEDSDLTRNLQLVAGYETISENWLTAFTGSGIYTNRNRIAPHIERLQAIYLERGFALSNVIDREAAPSNSELGRPVYRTTGLPALLIDTGIIGLLLLVANFVLTGITVFRSSSPNSRLLIVVLPVVFLWLMVSNTADIVLQYLLIMPGGLLVRLTESRSHRARAATATGPLIRGRSPQHFDSAAAPRATALGLASRPGAGVPAVAASTWFRAGVINSGAMTSRRIPQSTQRSRPK